jgi:Uma2 family endonuclease
MAKVPILAEHVNVPRFMLNVESVGLSPEQFFRLCSDNPDLRLELTFGFLVYPRKQRVYFYRPNRAAQCLDQPASVSGDPELPGFILDLTEIWK